MIALFALLLSLSGALAFFPLDSFWITDGGNKFMVMRSFQNSGTTDLTIRPSDVKFFPTGMFHFLPRGSGGFRSIFPPLFPAVCSYLFDWFGYVGLYLPSICGTMAVCVLLFLRHLRRGDNVGWFLLLLTAAVFATPIAFYSWTFWEMTIASAAATAALFSAADGRFRTAGALIGAMLYIRPEGYLLAAALSAALLSRKTPLTRIFAFLGAFAAAAAPLWLWQYHDSGNALGMQVALYHLHNVDADSEPLRRRLVGQMGNYFYYWFSFHGISDRFGRHIQTALSLAAAAAALAGVGFRRFRQGIRVKSAVCASAAVLWIAAVWRQWLNHEPVLSSIFTVGLWSSSPFLMLVLINIRPLIRCRRGMISLLTAAFVVFALLAPPFLTSHDLGIIWGPRHFLPLMPAASLLALYAARRMHAVRAWVVLVILSVAIQCFGWRSLRVMKVNSARLSGFLQRETGPVVVSDVYFLPMQTPRLFENKRWLYAADDTALAVLLKQLRREACMEFSLVTSVAGRYRRLSNRALRQLLAEAEIIRTPCTVELHGTAFLEMRVFAFRLRNGQLGGDGGDDKTR